MEVGDTDRKLLGLALALVITLVVAIVEGVIICLMIASRRQSNFMSREMEASGSNKVCPTTQVATDANETAKTDCGQIIDTDGVTLEGLEVDWVCLKQK
jgi:hypothetical protein